MGDETGTCPIEGFELWVGFGGDVPVIYREDWGVGEIGAPGCVVFVGVIRVSVTIPANTTAELLLPKAASKVITEENSDITGMRTIKSHIRIGDDVKLKLGSGEYHFEYNCEQL